MVRTLVAGGGSIQCYAQNLANDRGGEKGVYCKHEPSPGDGDLEGHIEQNVFVEVLVAVDREVLGVGGETKYCETIVRLAFVSCFKGGVQALVITAAEGMYNAHFRRS